MKRKKKKTKPKNKLIDLLTPSTRPTRDKQFLSKDGLYYSGSFCSPDFLDEIWPLDKLGNVILGDIENDIRLPLMERWPYLHWL